jgi:hypothetical protein
MMPLLIHYFAFAFAIIIDTLRDARRYARYAHHAVITIIFPARQRSSSPPMFVPDAFSAMQQQMRNILRVLQHENLRERCVTSAAGDRVRSPIAQSMAAQPQMQRECVARTMPQETPEHENSEMFFTMRDGGVVTPNREAEVHEKARKHQVRPQRFLQPRVKRTDERRANKEAKTSMPASDMRARCARCDTPRASTLLPMKENTPRWRMVRSSGARSAAMAPCPRSAAHQLIYAPTAAEVVPPVRAGTQRLSLVFSRDFAIALCRYVATCIFDYFCLLKYFFIF